MRTNKFIPFYLALSLHAIPFLYVLIHRSNPITPMTATKTIDLSTFSFSQKHGKPNERPLSNSSKSVGLPIRGNEKLLSGIENSNDINIGPGAQGLENKTGFSFIHFSQPIYPQIARQKGYEGKVKIKAYYNKEGAIIKVDVIESSGIKMLDEAVKRTASDWKISSTTNGNFEKTFEFKLNN